MRRGLASLALLAACGARTDLGGKHAVGAGADASAGDGGCVSEIVATDAKGASALALDGDVVFWGTQDGLVRTRDLGGTTTTLADAGATVDSIAVDSQYVYYAITGAIRRVARTGGSPSDFVTSAGQPFALAVSSNPSLGAGALYWLDYGDGIAAGSLHAKGQGGAETTLLAGLDTPSGLAVDDDYAYVPAAFADIDGLTYQGPLFHVDKVGGGHSTLASNLQEPSSVVVFDGDLYYVEQVGPNGLDGGGVRKIAVGGGVPTTVLHSGGGLLLDVAADASGVYATATNGGTGSLVQASAGAAPTELASTPNAGYGMVRTSATAIYWTVAWTGSPPADGASVRKLCK